MADPLTLSRLLLYGSPDTRRSLAIAAAGGDEPTAERILTTPLGGRES